MITRLKSSLFLWQGAVLIFLSSLPWIGLGKYTFSDMSGTIWPRLEILHLDFLYELLCIPIKLLIEFGIAETFFVFSDGKSIRPFMLFVFYLIMGIISLLVGFILFVFNENKEKQNDLTNSEA